MKFLVIWYIAYDYFLNVAIICTPFSDYAGAMFSGSDKALYALVHSFWSIKMSKITVQARLQAALSRADIPPNVQREVYNAVYAPNASTNVRARIKRDAQWQRLLDDIGTARSSLMSNKPKWPEFLASLYTEYTDMLSVLVQKVEAASSELTPKGEPLPLPLYTARQRARNKTREAAGKPVAGNCGPQWQSWVPPALIRSFTLQVENAYAIREAEDGAPRRGKRFVPFMTAAYREQTAKRTRILREAINRIRGDYCTTGTAEVKADSAYGAVMLAMCRKAERRLAQLANSAKAFEEMVPIKFTHLLEPADRQRLVDATQSPNDVPLTDDIRAFYYVPHAGTTEAAHVHPAYLVQELFADEHS